MDKKYEKITGIEDSSYTASVTGLISLLKFLGKKNKKELDNPRSGKLVMKKLKITDVDALKLNGKNIKVFKKGSTGTGNGKVERQNLFTIPLKQFGLKQREILGVKPNKLIKNSARESRKVKYLESSTSLTLTTKQKNYNPRKVGKKSLRSVSSSSNRTLTIKCKKSSRLLIPQTTYNNILMNSIPSKIIHSNIKNPVFVPKRSIWKRNPSDGNTENQPAVNIVPVRSIKERKHTIYSNIKTPQIVPEVSIWERKLEANSLSEPENYNQPEFLRDLENKTKVIPDLMEKVKSIEGQLKNMSTKKITEFDPEHNKSDHLSNPLGNTPTVDRPHVQISKIHMASKRNKRTKGKRHKAREQSTSLSSQNRFTSGSCKNLNFVFEPKSQECSSTFAAPIQTGIPHSFTYSSCPDGNENVISAPGKDAKLSQCQGECECYEKSWEGLFKGAAFANVLRGNDMMQLLQQLQNNFSLPSNSGELYLVEESQNLQRLENSTTKNTNVTQKNQVNDNEIAENLHDSSQTLVCENIKESPNTLKVLSNEEICYCNKLKNEKTDQVKPDTGRETQQFPEPPKKNDNTEDNIFEWLNSCTKNEKNPELSITVQFKDGNKSVTFESSTPKIFQLPQSDKPGGRGNELTDNYVNAIGRSKVQPISTRSILTSPRNYHEMKKEEARYTSVESLIAARSFEFDSSGEGDVPFPITKAGMRTFEEDKIKFVSEERDFSLGESCGYLDRKRREVFDEKIRSITSCSNVRSPYPRATLVHFMTNDVVDDTEEKTLNLNSYDCDGINGESGLIAPICRDWVDEDSDIKYTNNIDIEHSIKMNRCSKIFTFTADSDEDQKFKLGSNVRFQRRMFTKLEDIREASEPDSEEDQLAMVDSKDEDTGMNITSNKSSVSVQTELELIDVSFDWALLFYRLAEGLNLNNSHVEDQTEFKRFTAESASSSKGDFDLIDLPKVFEVSAEFNTIQPKLLHMNRSSSMSHVHNEDPDEDIKFEIDSKVGLKKYELSKLEVIEESEEEHMTSFEPVDILGIISNGPKCEIKESSIFLNGEVPNGSMLLKGQPNKEAGNNVNADKKEIPRKKKTHEPEITEKFTKHVCSKWCFCPTTDDDRVLNSDLDIDRDYYLLCDEIKPHVGKVVKRF